ncbi:MAG: VPLPA-CTERM sorting domain-containing protein [Rhodobacteraceae bacterium]|nr:VPLPA-CTERM sorting domain-containing protein [Paracoccaceae bacterium]
MKITRLIRATGYAAVLAIASAGSALAATMTLDFTGETVGALAGDTFSKSQGALTFTFNGPGLRIRTLPSAFETAYSLDRWLSTTADAGPIEMLISGGVINSVRYLNPINGSVTSEIDVIDAVAYDALSTVLDSASNSNEYNTLFGPDIARMTFVEGSGGSGFVLGQFVVDYTAAAIPLPAGFPLLLAGLGGLAVLRRRKKPA